MFIGEQFMYISLTRLMFWPVYTILMIDTSDEPIIYQVLNLWNTARPSYKYNTQNPVDDGRGLIDQKQ